MSLKIGRSHKARKALFTRGIRRGFLSVREIDEALPAGSLTDAERWLLYYSLHAARVEIRDDDGNTVDVESMRPRAGMEDAAMDDGEIDAAEMDGEEISPDQH